MACLLDGIKLAEQDLPICCEVLPILLFASLEGTLHHLVYNRPFCNLGTSNLAGGNG